MSVGFIIFLIAVGFFLLLVEVLVTPGIIVGAIGLFFMGFGVYKTFVDHGNTAGTIVLVSVFLVSVTVLVIALKTGAWDRMASKDSIASKVNVIDENKVKIGDTGKSLSALRPSGNALINGLRVEVTTEGEIIETHQEVEVIAISKNKVIVKLVS